MIERSCDSWEQFERRLDEFFAMRPLDRDRFIFRGQADASWLLSTTLDRYMGKHHLSDREKTRLLLQRTFAEQAAALDGYPAGLADDSILLLARHHGLPSSIMDWTRSPYIAAFFAFSDSVHDGPGAPSTIAVWCLDLQASVGPFGDNVEIIDGHEVIRLVPRAIEQRSVFINLRHLFKLEELPDDALRRFTVPAAERVPVLARMEGMGLSERSLFRSLDSAAGVASWRVRAIQSGTP